MAKLRMNMSRLRHAAVNLLASGRFEDALVNEEHLNDGKITMAVMRPLPARATAMPNQEIERSARRFASGAGRPDRDSQDSLSALKSDRQRSSPSVRANPHPYRLVAARRSWPPPPSRRNRNTSAIRFGAPDSCRTEMSPIPAVPDDQPDPLKRSIRSYERAAGFGQHEGTCEWPGMGLGGSAHHDPH